VLLDEELREAASFCFIIKPDRYIISPEVSKIHGISHEQAVAGGTDEMYVLELFQDLCARASRLVAHNIQFDGIVLGRANHIYGLTYEPPEPYCTMKASTERCALPGQAGQYKVPSLVEAHLKLVGRPFDGAHNALADCQACARVYAALQGKLPPPPVESLPDLREYNDSTLMPFGKYKGTPLGRLSKSYCSWLYEQKTLSDKALYRWLHGEKKKAKQPAPPLVSSLEEDTDFPY
jgi:DNA polymerase-3 subunit epsilon